MQPLVDCVTFDSESLTNLISIVAFKAHSHQQAIVVTEVCQQVIEGFSAGNVFGR